MIQVNSIELQNFRGIQTGTLAGLSDVNLLVGRNNAGKTTVAEGMSWALETLASHYGKPSDPINRTSSNVWEQVRKGTFVQPELWFRQDQSQPLLVTIKLDDLNLKVGFDFSSGGWKPRIFEPDMKPPLGNPCVLFARSVTIFRPSDATNSDIENLLWPKLISNRRDKVLTKILNEIFKMDAEGFHPLPNNKLQVLFPSYSISLDLQGDGTRAAFRCLMLLAALPSTLFILEEPECHQHPGSLGRFAAAICKQAKEQQVQLLISTHSMECVRAFLAGTKQAGAESAVFNLKLNDGVLDSKRLDADTVATLEETGVDVRLLDLYG